MPDAWEPAPPAPALDAGQVHVWRASLVATDDELARHHAVLSDEERSRAGRFRFDVHRNRFVAGRGIQRRVLARYLGVDPGAIRYRLAEHGKPSLAGAETESGVRFNVSNSENGLLIAVSLGRELGVDLEAVLPVSDRDGVARRFFSAPENEVYDTIAHDARDLAFFTCWTRKEAYIKALGSGLSHPLDQFDVTLTAHEPAALLRDAQDAEAIARWQMFNLEFTDRYAGALVVEGREEGFRGFELRAFELP